VKLLFLQSADVQLLCSAVTSQLLVLHIHGANNFNVISDSALYNNTGQSDVGTSTSRFPDIPPDITTASTLTSTTSTTTTTLRPEATISTTDVSKVTSEVMPTTNATQDFDLNMTDFRQGKELLG
jgi:hypothetical protein